MEARRAAVLALVPLLAVAGLPVAHGSADARVHVHVQNYDLLPADLSLAVGETVHWDNHDNDTHNLRADDESFNSGFMFLGDEFEVRFDAQVNVAYRCTIHDWMRGTIVAVDPAELPDVRVEAIEAAEVLPGLETRIRATVLNAGASATPPTWVLFAYLYQGEARPVDLAGVPTLAPGDRAEVQARWNTLGKVGDFVVLARADSLGQVTEGSEGDNERQARASVLVGGVEGIVLFEVPR